MIVLGCGSRNWRAVLPVRHYLACLPADLLIHGGQRGADTCCAEQARKLGWSVEGFPADWDRYGKRAGPLRNQRMLERALTDETVLLLAFHEDPRLGRGTRDMVNRWREHRMPSAVYIGSPITLSKAAPRLCDCGDAPSRHPALLAQKPGWRLLCNGNAVPSDQSLEPIQAVLFKHSEVSQEGL